MVVCRLLILENIAYMLCLAWEFTMEKWLGINSCVFGVLSLSQKYIFFKLSLIWHGILRMHMMFF